MKRPNIDELKNYMEGCCGENIGKRFCDSYGCVNIKELIDYIEFLENILSIHEVTYAIRRS